MSLSVCFWCCCIDVFASLPAFVFYKRPVFFFFFWGGGFKIMGGIKDLLQRKVNKIFISHGRQTLSSHLLKQSLPWFSGWHFSNSTDAICLCGLFYGGLVLSFCISLNSSLFSALALGSVACEFLGRWYTDLNQNLEHRWVFDLLSAVFQKCSLHILNLVGIADSSILRQSRGRVFDPLGSEPNQ